MIASKSQPFSVSPPTSHCSLIALIIASVLSTSFAGCHSGTPDATSADLDARKQKIQQMEESPTAEALQRKQRSLAILQKQNIPVLESLPVIATEETSTRRSTEEVALRAMALCIVAVKGEGLEQDIVDELVDEYQLKSAFSPDELEFLKNPNPSQQDRAQFAWRYECYWVMLWALGFIDDMGAPDTICDVPKSVAFLRDLGRDGFLKQAKLRPQSELLDAADLMYRYDWAAVNARVQGQPYPEGLDGEITVERHKALNWLIGYMDQAWDDVSTDT